jgi:hypothetical protein
MLILFLGIVAIVGNNVNAGPEFTAMSIQMASVHPSSTSMSDYTPTSPIPTACKSQLAVASSAGFASSIPSTTIPIATNLPPRPDDRLCECMMGSLDCVAKQKFTPGSYWLDSEPFERRIAYSSERELVQSACGRNASWCLGSETNSNTGQYGAFSVCNSTERGSWILDQMYKASNKDPSVCTSTGGVLVGVANPVAQLDDCRAILRQAGPQGTGTITYSSLPIGRKVSRGGLSAAENIGLAIGILLVVMISAASILLLRRRKGRKRSVEENNKDGTDNFGKVELPTNPASRDRKLDGKAELPYSPAYTDKKWDGQVERIERIEKDGEEKFELDVGTEYIEMPTEYNKRVELEGSPLKYAAK